MKKTFLLIMIITFHVNFALGFQIANKFFQTEAGELYKINSFHCDLNEFHYCMTLCGSTMSCEKIEPHCHSCAGTTWPLLKEIYTQLSVYYQSDFREIEIGEIVKYFGKINFVIFDSQDIYNYYKPVEGRTFSKDLESFCHGKEVKPLLVIELDEVNIPKELTMVLCQYSSGKTTGHRVYKKIPELGSVEDSPYDISLN